MVCMAATYRFSIRRLENTREDIDELVDLRLGVVEVRAGTKPPFARRDDRTVFLA